MLGCLLFGNSVDYCCVIVIVLYLCIMVGVLVFCCLFCFAWCWLALFSVC